MYETPAFNESNEKILCEMGGKNADMLMTIKVKRMAAGESFTLCSASNETRRFAAGRRSGISV